MLKLYVVQAIKGSVDTLKDEQVNASDFIIFKLRNRGIKESLTVVNKYYDIDDSIESLGKCIQDLASADIVVFVDGVLSPNYKNPHIIRTIVLANQIPTFYMNSRDEVNLSDEVTLNKFYKERINHG